MFVHFMVKVRDVGSLSELFLDLLIQGNRLAYFRNTILNVNVLNVKTGVEGFNRGLLDGFERLHHRVEKELYLLLLELDSRRLQTLDVTV